VSRFRCKPNNRENGQSIVELALILPVFTIILFAIIEFGRLWMTVNVMSGAAREGARVAALSGTDFTQARATALNVMTSGNINGASVSVSGPNSANEIRVTVSLRYSTITGAIIPGLSRTMQLSRSATMRWEG
jgi:Flp pilus assembly protein TadG